MSISYRWKNETGPFREINVLDSAIRVADLKIMIAERSGLSHEFARNIDIHLLKPDFNLEGLDNNTDGAHQIQNYYEEDELIEPFTQIIAVRGPWKNHQDIVHQARTQLTKEEWKLPSLNDSSIRKVKKKEVPKELVCSMCNCPMIEPMLIKCGNNCGSNACRKCLKQTEDDLCPTCGGKIIGFIQNRVLERLIEKTNWESFDLKSKSDEPHRLDDTLLTNTSTTITNLSNKAGINSQELSNINQNNSDLISQCFIIEFNMHNLSLLRNYNFLVLETNSLILNHLLSYPNLEKISVMGCAQVGGGTSYAIGGFFYISLSDKLNKPIMDPSAILLTKNWQYTHKSSFNLENENLFSIDWNEKYENMPMLPLRKQPLWGLLNHASRFYKTKNNISSKPIMTEVSLTSLKFEELRLNIQDYINNGSRTNVIGLIPFNEKSSQMCGTQDTMIEPVVKHNKKYNECNSEIKNIKKNTYTSLDPNSSLIYFPGSPLLYSMDGEFEFLNPYISYCSVLPFLSIEQFNNIQKIQKAAKFFVKKRSFIFNSNPPLISSAKRSKSDLQSQSILVSSTSQSSSTSNNEYDSDESGIDINTNNFQMLQN